MKTFLFKLYYLLSSPMVKGNWTKLFMSLEEIEIKKNEDKPRVFVTIEPLEGSKLKHRKASLKKLLGRKCKYVSDNINGVQINEFFSKYGRDIGYIATKCDNYGWTTMTVVIVGGLAEEIIELFQNQEFLQLDGINVRPRTDSYEPLYHYNRLVKNAYEEMISSLETRPKVCLECTGDEEGDHWIDSDFECQHCSSIAPGKKERLPEDDTAGMLEALEIHRITTTKVFLEINKND